MAHKKKKQAMRARAQKHAAKEANKFQNTKPGVNNSKLPIVLEVLTIITVITEIIY